MKQDRTYWKVMFLGCLFSGAFLWSQTPSIVEDARFKGAFGARVAVGLGDQMVEDGSPEAEVNYRARFYISVNDLDMAGTNQFTLFSGRNSGGTAHFEVFVVGSPQGHEVFARARLDDGTFLTTTTTPLIRGWQALDLQWVAGDGTGSLALIKDGVLEGEVTGMDNDQAVIDVVQLGKVNETGSGNSGTFDLDDFSSRKLSNPGLVCLTPAEFLSFIADWPVRDLLEEMDLLARRCTN